ncbi:MAG: tRNA uridine-5-carboxymethylaminomethyl(34) synthesis GTPase MnmE [Kiritimatiellae bacterium]|nr:tRNA uridine-5-carboxymethylaminomethyl(34) synthesis GTPase MnmE [Kiritimatiellia bacterium]
MSEPIAALATASGMGGVAVIRLSGDEVYTVADQLTRLKTPPSQRKAGTFAYASLYDGKGDVMDDAVLLFFRAPHSYTGEDTVELHVHGGQIVPQRVLKRLWELGVRPAQPGEFTKRAFLNGRMDLTQAEAVADIIAARSPRAERAARANLQGQLGQTLIPLYEDTLAHSVQVEHLLDFDEGELPEDFFEEAEATLQQLVERTQALLATWHESRLVRDGALVVLAGKPNAGKSTLLNLLLGYERAIVSNEAGTTRDSIEETFLLDGVPIRLTDTAGLRDAPGAVEREGVSRTKALLEQADVVLYLTAEPDNDPPPQGAIVIHTKTDLTPAPAGSLAISVRCEPQRARETVCQALRDALKLSQGETAHATLANERQFALLSTADKALHEAITAFRQGDLGYVPAAQQLRAAAEALGDILGRTYADDLLDRVFSTFCVGK